MTAWCPAHQTGMRRVWTPPVLSIPEQSAVDVMNRHVRGEGDPAPGMNQAETKWVANEMARVQKRERFQKPGNTPTRSYPGGGNPRKVYE